MRSFTRERDGPDALVLAVSIKNVIPVTIYVLHRDVSNRALKHSGRVNKGPVDKSKNTVKTRSGPSRIAI